MSKQPLSIFLKNVTENYYNSRTKKEFEMMIATFLTDQDGKPVMSKDEALDAIKEGLMGSLADTFTEQLLINMGINQRLDPQTGDLINDIPEIGQNYYGKYCLNYFGDLLSKTYDESIEKLSHGKPK